MVAVGYNMVSKRTITTIAITLVILTVLGVGIGAVSGQILTEQEYYNETFEEYEEHQALPQEAETDQVKAHIEANPDRWTHRGLPSADNQDLEREYAFWPRADDYRLGYVSRTNDIRTDKQTNLMFHGWYDRATPAIHQTTIDVPDDIDDDESIYVTAQLASYEDDDGNDHNVYAVAAGNQYFGGSDSDDWYGHNYTNSDVDRWDRRGSGGLMPFSINQQDHVSVTDDLDQVWPDDPTEDPYMTPWEEDYGVAEEADEEGAVHEFEPQHRITRSQNNYDYVFFEIENPEEHTPHGEDEIIFHAGINNDCCGESVGVWIKNLHVVGEDWAGENADVENELQPSSDLPDVDSDDGMGYSTAQSIIESYHYDINDAVHEETQLPEDEPDGYEIEKDYGFEEHLETQKLVHEDGTIEKEYDLPELQDAQVAYFSMTAESKYDEFDNLDWRIEQFGQEIAAGGVDSGSIEEEVAEIDSETNDMTLIVESDDPYAIHDISFSTLEQDIQGDPLQTESEPVTLDADEGYDSIMNIFTSGLDITTDTIIVIVMIALAFGAIIFTYSKSVRGQDFAQSMMFGAVVVGILLVGVVPMMNTITWVFTGDTDRAPLADPALEAEPPSYYSTAFQGGTQDGWEESQGTARPVSAGEGFDLEFVGEPGQIHQTTHISLGESLDTGFVGMEVRAESTTGYGQDGGDPHEVTVYADVYVEDREGNEDHVVEREEIIRSFDGQVAATEETLTFPLDGTDIRVELTAESNRDEEQAVAALENVNVGATVEGMGEQD